MKVNDGKLSFADENDRAAFRRLFQISKNLRVILIVESNDVGKVISEKQFNLFIQLVKLISEETGQDFSTVENTLYENFFPNSHYNRNDLREMKMTTFNDFFEWSLSFAQDFFNLNISYNEKTSRLECGNTY